MVRVTRSWNGRRGGVGQIQKLRMTTAGGEES